MQKVAPHVGRRTLMGTLLIGLSLTWLTLSGCVERTISITSEPDGALVYLNDEEVGRTPVTVPFLYYGTYDVRLEKDGYRPLWTQKKARGPLWELPGPDLVFEMIPNARVALDWHFSMNAKQEQDLDPDAVINRARQMRALTNQMD